LLSKVKLEALYQADIEFLLKLLRLSPTGFRAISEAKLSIFFFCGDLSMGPYRLSSTTNPPSEILILCQLINWSALAPHP
jgi:hypothetical protein